MSIMSTVLAITLILKGWQLLYTVLRIKSKPLNILYKDLYDPAITHSTNLNFRSFFSSFSSPAVLVFDNFSIVKFFSASLFSEHTYLLLPLVLSLQALRLTGSFSNFRPYCLNKAFPWPLFLILLSSRYIVHNHFMFISLFVNFPIPLNIDYWALTSCWFDLSICKASGRGLPFYTALY